MYMQIDSYRNMYTNWKFFEGTILHNSYIGKCEIGKKLEKRLMLILDLFGVPSECLDVFVWYFSNDDDNKIISENYNIDLHLLFKYITI